MNASAVSRASACRRYAIIVGTMLMGTLASCQVSPNYSRPTLDVPAGYKSAATAPSATQPAATQAATPPAGIAHLSTDWWTLFDDPELTALEEAAAAHNPDLAAAMARVVEARSASSSVASAFYPQITANPSDLRSRSSGTRGTKSRTTSDPRIPFDLSYEVDIWGRVKRSVEASNAQVQASVDDYAVILQTLQADVAQDYFTLRSFEAQDEIYTRSVALYSEQIALTQKKKDAGLAGGADVALLQPLQAAAEAQQIDVRRQRADLEHALAILTGRPPADFALAGAPAHLRAVPAIPPGLPSALLRHRPDVAMAEDNLIAANAQVGVATANFYPTVTLTGAAGFESIDIQHVVDWESRIWSLGPSISIPLFEGGKLTANLQQAKARYDELVATYRSTVLSAFRDVEDALNDVHSYNDGLEAQNRAVDAARNYLRLSTLEMDAAGILSPLQVLDADRTLLTNELQQNQIRTQRLVSTVLLIKALGGGWDQSNPIAGK